MKKLFLILFFASLSTISFSNANSFTTVNSVNQKSTSMIFEFYHITFTYNGCTYNLQVYTNGAGSGEFYLGRDCGDGVPRSIFFTFEYDVDTNLIRTGSITPELEAEAEYSDPQLLEIIEVEINAVLSN